MTQAANIRKLTNKCAQQQIYIYLQINELRSLLKIAVNWADGKYSSFHFYSLKLLNEEVLSHTSLLETIEAKGAAMTEHYITQLEFQELQERYRVIKERTKVRLSLSHVESFQYECFELDLLPDYAMPIKWITQVILMVYTYHWQK